MLSKGPVEVKKVDEAAEADGISRITLKRARKKLGVKAEKEQGVIDGKWFLYIGTERDQKGVKTPTYC